MEHTRPYLTLHDWSVTLYRYSNGMMRFITTVAFFAWLIAIRFFFGIYNQQTDWRRLDAFWVLKYMNYDGTIPEVLQYRGQPTESSATNP
jgi:hypothetical protein